MLSRAQEARVRAILWSGPPGTVQTYCLEHLAAATKIISRSSCERCTSAPGHSGRSRLRLHPPLTHQAPLVGLVDAHRLIEARLARLRPGTRRVTQVAGAAGGQRFTLRVVGLELLVIGGPGGTPWCPAPAPKPTPGPACGIRPRNTAR